MVKDTPYNCNYLDFCDNNFICATAKFLESNQLLRIRKMNIVQVEENLKKITAKISKDTFIFDLMWAYDFPKACANVMDSSL